MKLASTSLFSLLINSHRPLASSGYTASSRTTAFSSRACSSFLLITSDNNSNTSRHRMGTRLFSAAPDTAIFDDVSITLEGPELPDIPSGSKRLFLVRHGEVINPGGDRPVYYGCQDVKLSPLGELEAKAAGAYLKQFNLQNVAASPLTRAKFGANEVLLRQENKSDAQDIKVFPGFTEMDRGAWCGLTIGEIGEDMMASFDNCDESVTPEGGESYPGLKERVLAARDELLAMTDEGNASAVVSHLQVTRSMLSDALDIPVKEMSTLKVATASVTCVDVDSATGAQTVHFQSFKPDAGLQKSYDGAN